MEYVEAEGNSIDDAIERALQQLGVARDKVDVEIIANATKGLFGLGGKKAKVRATLRAPISLTDPAEQRREEAAARRREASPTRAKRARSEQPRRQRRERPQSANGNAREAGNGRPRAARAERDERPLVEISEDTLETARAVLENTVRLIGTEASVKVTRDDLGTCLEIDGDESGILIGRRGQTLDALEYMINRVASRDTRHTTHLVVDSQGYRQRRREALETLAQRMGERAEQRGKTVTMNPMSPRDRRIVHLALQDNPSLETRSAGNGYFRKLLIIPDARRR
jgi:spoIIIJ-associated protein